MHLAPMRGWASRSIWLRRPIESGPLVSEALTILAVVTNLDREHMDDYHHHGRCRAMRLSSS